MFGVRIDNALYVANVGDSVSDTIPTTAQLRLDLPLVGMTLLYLSIAFSSI